MSRKWLLLLLLPILVVALAACGEDDDEDDNGDEAAEELSANAGEDFMVMVGEAPTFNACDSSGDITNYQWTILEAPETRSEDNGKMIREIETDCEFTLEDTMILEEAGAWNIEVEISDDDGNTATDTVLVTVEAGEDADDDENDEADTENDEADTDTEEDSES